MKAEIEAKFLNVSFEQVRNKLESMGGRCVKPSVLMKRALVDLPGNVLQKQDVIIRVRDEGDKTTLTYKHFDSLSVGGASEIEIIVSSFENTIELFQKLGYELRSLQESRREVWVYDGVEIMLDEWPWLNPYIEIEGESEASIQEVATKLGYNWESDAVFGDVMAAYRAQYPHLTLTDTVGNIPIVRFGDELPEMFKS